MNVKSSGIICEIQFIAELRTSQNFATRKLDILDAVCVTVGAAVATKAARNVILILVVDFYFVFTMPMKFTVR